MNAMNLFRLGLVSLAYSAQAVAQDAEKLQIDVPTQGEVELSWVGQNGKNYFMEWSTDLKEWGFMPMVSAGTGGPLAFGFESDTDKFFVRLRYSDHVTLDPKNDDFDGDGLSNWEEVSAWDTNPFAKDSDGDGIHDGHSDTDTDGISDEWEQDVIRQLYSPNVTAISDIDDTTDSDGDGVSDLDEFEAGYIGFLKDSDGDGYSDFLSFHQAVHYQLNESTGSVAFDSSAQELHANTVGNPTWSPTSGIEGGTLALADSDDVIELLPSTIHGKNDVIVSFWFKTQGSSNTQTLLSAALAPAAADFSIKLLETNVPSDTLQVTLSASESFTWTGARSYGDDRWHHVVLVRSSDSASLYLDNHEIASHTAAAPMAAIAADSFVVGQDIDVNGGYVSGAHFVGAVDEVRIFDSSDLSQDHVAELYQLNDLDADGLPDDYEIAMTQNLTTLVGAEGDLDGDGLSNLDELLSGSDPLDFYNGETPTLTLVSGDNQSIYNGDITEQPITFKVTLGGSTPIEGAPITVEHLQLLGSVLSTDQIQSTSSLQLTSDSNGDVSVFFQAN